MLRANEFRQSTKTFLFKIDSKGKVAATDGAPKVDELRRDEVRGYAEGATCSGHSKAVKENWALVGLARTWTRAVVSATLESSASSWQLFERFRKRAWRRCVAFSISLLLASFSLNSVWAAACSAKFSFGYDEPERQGFNSQKLVELTQWLRDNPARVLSLTISRNGKIVYELYTSRLDRNDAHYLMSVTKSVTSALIGVAMDRHLVKAANSAVAENLPAAVFPGAEALKRFQRVTLKDVLGMSALDAQVPPHQKTPEAIDRLNRFLRSPNRLNFALEQATLAHVGNDFQYTDITPMIAGGIVQYATKQTLLSFGKTALFDPMGFRNVEWMHQDKSDLDNASYGLRLRPIDMQKFGILFLNQGCWEGQQLVSKEWVSTSFTPWIKSRPDNREANYGWYWWIDRFASGWIGHTANGWKGQRITVVPDKGIVATMTAIVEDDTDGRLYSELFNRFIIPSVETSAPISDSKARLKSVLADVWTNKTAIGPNTEARMLPSEALKERH